MKKLHKEAKQLSTPEVVFNQDRKSITIKNLNIENDEFYDFLKDKKNPADWISKTLQIGFLGLKNMLVGYNVDYVDKRFGEFLKAVEKQFSEEKQELKEKIDETFDITKSTSSVGKLYKRIDELFDPKNKTSVITLMDERIDKMFNENNKESAISKLTKLLEQYFNDKTGVVKMLIDDTFNPKKKDSPIAKLKDDLEQYFGKEGLLAKQLQANLNVDDKTTPLGKLSRQLDDVFDERKGKVRNLLDSAFDFKIKTSAMSKFVELLEKNFNVDSGTIKQLLDPNRDGSPINLLKKDVLADLTVIKERIIAEEAAAEEREHGTAKGLDFEDEVESVLNRIARPYGDLVEPKGKERGGRGKKGDFVILVDQSDQQVISIEAKDRYLGGAKKVLEELDLGMKNRHARFGIMVFKTEDQLPSEFKPVKILNDRIIISAEHHGLYFAYRIGRLFIETSLRVKEGSLPLDKVQTELQKLLELSRVFDNLEVQGNNISKAGNSVRDEATKLKSSIETIIDKIKEMLKL